MARKSDASIAKIAKDFGVSESCLQRWLAQADIEGGWRLKDLYALSGYANNGLASM